MKVLVGCEFSGVVRDAFLDVGADAWSCDLQPSESMRGPHIQRDVLAVLEERWDLAILHPPCTHTAVSGARWFARKQQEQKAALAFNAALWAAAPTKAVLEQPVSITPRVLGKPSQVIQPWQHGHGETKATCLWVRGLPLLRPSNVVSGRSDRIHKMPGGKDQARNRSRTLPGVAAAMAAQWGPRPIEVNP